MALLGGCATVNTGIEQTILVVTPGAESASCELSNGPYKQHKWRVQRTPATITVRKSDEPLTVTCTKIGYRNAEVVLPPYFLGSTEENLLMGGGVTLLLVAVDEMLESHWHYPDRVEVPMRPERTDRTARKELALDATRRSQEELEIAMWNSAQRSYEWVEDTPRPAAILNRFEGSRRRQYYEEVIW